MNVYSIRLIPSLKLKFCEFLGIASSVAIEQLTERLGSLERKMGQLDEKVRRNGGRLPESTLKITPRPKPKKRPVAKPVLAWPEDVILAAPVATPTKRKTTRRVSPQASKAGSSATANLLSLTPNQDESGDIAASPAVILLKQDEATAQTVHDYFGSEVEILQVDGFEDLEDLLDGRLVLAIFFDRILLGEAGDRESLKQLSVSYPETTMVGISSYLTLALAEAVPPEDDGFTFLTKPLSQKSLSEILSKKDAAAIS